MILYLLYSYVTEVDKMNDNYFVLCIYSCETVPNNWKLKKEYQMLSGFEVKITHAFRVIQPQAALWSTQDRNAHKHRACPFHKL